MTREIATDAGGDAWSWRVSLATLSADAPFSLFPGCDRTLLLVEGGPVVLTAPEWQRTLNAGMSIAFAGEEMIAAGVASAALALNVMSRRERLRHTVERVRTAGTIDAALTVALSEGWSSNGEPLARFDAVEGRATLTGGGEAVVVRLAT